MKFFQRRTDHDKRGPYRVRMEHSPLRVFLVRGAKMIEAEVVDVSSTGCGFRMPVAAALDLTEGQPLDLRFLAKDTERHVFAEARVRSVSEEHGFRRYGVQFVHPEKIEAQFDETLWRFFNRREAFRVQPERVRGGNLKATLRRGDTAGQYLLHDISTTGLAIRLSRKDTTRFEPGDRFECELELPGIDRVLTMVVRVMYEQQLRGARRIGLRFDTDATPGSEELQDLILGYVLERQRAVLRQLGR